MFRLFTVLVLLISSSPAFAEQLNIELEIDRYTGTIRLEAASSEIKDSYLTLDGKCEKTFEKKRLF